jgi:hypothetical protein
MAQNTSSALGRLHALWTLEGIGELKPPVIEQALKDPVAGVRENAIKLAEIHLSASPTLEIALLSLKNDLDAKVRYQLLCSLGSVNTPQSAQVRNELLFRDINDEWVQVAALSATSSQTASLLETVIDSFKQDVQAYGSLVKRLSSMIAVSGKTEVIHQLIQKSVTPGAKEQASWQGPLLQGISQGLKTRKKSSVFKGEQDRLIQALFENPSILVRNASLDLLKVIGLQKTASVKIAKNKAVAIAGDNSQPEGKRVEMINFIAVADPAPYAKLLQKLLSPTEPSSIQLAALKTWSTIPNNSVSQYLLARWSNLTPEIRDEAINTFMVNPGRIAMLLDAIESAKIQTTSIGWSRSVRLMAQSDLKLRERARKHLTKDESERANVNKKYEASLTLTQNTENGKKFSSRIVQAVTR